MAKTERTGDSMVRKRNHRRVKRKAIQKWGAGLIAILLIITMIVGLMPVNTNNVIAAETTADDNTITKYLESLGDEVSTEYAGRVWTDKSVYSGDATFTGGKLNNGTGAYTETNDSDFLVSFSALSTSIALTGHSQAAVDVVFVLDLSGSMGNSDSKMDNGKSRIANLVTEVNTSIEKILSMNENNRVAVVGFNARAIEILPLDHYTKNGTDPYFKVNVETPPTPDPKLDWAVISNAKITVSAVNSSNNHIRDTIDVTDGTNIQAGMYTGMKLLANATSTTVEIGGETINRIPSVILLSDGAPTYSSDSKSWWAPGNNNGDGPGSSAYYGNGMKAMMTASYMKEAINRKYNTNKTTVYTIGMGISDLENGDEKNLARITLNPKEHWNADNDMSKAIRDAWTSYSAGNTPNVLVNLSTDKKGKVIYDNYTLNHPTSNDITNISNYVDSHYDANSASGVTQVFEDIVDNIILSAPQIPTEVTNNNPLTSGYITYTDPIGDYMEVKDVKTIIYYDQIFHRTQDPVTEGNKTTYVFEGEVTGAIHGDHDLSHTIIEVITNTDANGVKSQVLTIKIPAATIPVRVNSVELNGEGENVTVVKHENNGVKPMRILYTVGLQDGILNAEGEVTSKVSSDYITKHINEQGEVSFYSNYYDGTNVVNGNTAGNATAEFEPAHNNPFYYMQEDVTIYTDAACTQPVEVNTGIVEEDIDPKTTYYYTETYYHGNDIVTDLVIRTGEQLLGTSMKSVNGYWKRAAGSPRPNRILEFEGTKAVNSTGTAADFYAPTFVYAEGSTDPYEGKYVIYLGNNGVLRAPGRGSLAISKTVTADAGLTAPDKDFTFNVSLKDSEGSGLSGTYPYNLTDLLGNAILDENDNPVTGLIANGGTLTLKDGQKAIIINLPPGATYEVTETAAAGFKTTVGTQETNVAAGTIVAGEISNAAYGNHYSVRPMEVPASAAFPGSKTFTGREWTDSDSFSFLITPENGAPMPEGTTNGVVTVTKEHAANGTAAFNFGKVTFTAPGEYSYTISEPEPADRAPGVTYTQVHYRVAFVVKDSGNGNLYLESRTLTQITDESGTLLSTPVAADAMSFTNTFDAKEVKISLSVAKNYTDHSGSNPLTDGKFQFELKPVGTNAAAAPMPVNAATTGDREIIVGNINKGAAFGDMTFTQEMIGQTFTYEISEVIPSGAHANGDGTYTLDGMTYDGSVHTVTVVVSLDGENVVATVTYEDGTQYASFTNEYTPDEIVLESETALKGTKTLNGRNMKGEETFEFILTADHTTAQAIEDGIVTISTDKATVTGGVDGQAVPFDFGKMTFTKVGVYTFTITETAGNAGGVTYDSHTCTVTVTVESVNGKLEATVTYNNGTGATDNSQAVFTNTYAADEYEGMPINLDGTKNFTGQSLEAGEFFFTIEAVEKAPLGDTVTFVSNNEGIDDDGDGTYTATVPLLKNITYTEAGTYVYKIKENIPSTPRKGVTYDTTEYVVTVSVIDDGNGKLVAQTPVIHKTGETTATNSVTFVNSYKPEKAVYVPFALTKVLNGNRPNDLEANEFYFIKEVVSATYADGIRFLDDTDNDGVVKVGNRADADADGDGIYMGTVQFGNVEFTKAGTYVVEIREEIPADSEKAAGITYDTHVLRSTFRVTDDQNGNLTVVRTDSINGRQFTNTYSSEGELQGDTYLKVAKNLTGREWKEGDSFTFTLTPAEDTDTQAALANGDIVMPDNATGIIITYNDAVKENAFGDITFKKAGTYYFNIIEGTANALAGVNYDTTPRVVKVTAVEENPEDANGNLTVTAEVEGGLTLTFINSYVPDDTYLYGHNSLLVTKEFTGRPNDQWLSTDAFKFVLAAADDATKAAVTAGTVVLPAETELVINSTNKDHAHFGNIEFKQAGTYKFTVTEQASGIDGVVNDPKAERTIIVEVVDKDSILVATIADGSDSLTFSNVYTPEEAVLDGAANLVVEKVLVGRDWKEGDTFEFVLTAASHDGGVTQEAIDNGDIILPAVTTKTIDKNSTDHKVAFDDITFNKTGTYYFNINETAGNLKGLEYDGHTAYVRVIVTDGNDGKLYAAATTIGSMVFTNTYTPVPITATITGTKAMTGRDLTATDKFTFAIAKAAGSAEDTPMPTAATTVNGADGSIAFVPITFTKAGTYQYVITESGYVPGVTNDTTAITATVVVNYSEATGELSIADITYSAGDGNGFVFTNTYNTTPSNPITTFTAVKRVNAAEGTTYTLQAGDFEFTITPDANNPASDPVVQTTVANDANGNVIFFKDVNGGVEGITYTEEGTYVYTVSEVQGDRGGILYDGSKYTIVVEVKDDPAVAKLNATATIYNEESEPVTGILFENAYSAEDAKLEGATNLKVTKDLSGRDWQEGDAFRFELKASAIDSGVTQAAVTAGIVELPESIITITKDSPNYQAAFGDIVFKRTGTYHFDIYELNDGQSQITYDNHVVTVEVVVTDNGTGKLIAVAPTTAGSLTFTNTYTPNPITASLTGTKVMEGRELTNTDTFSFKVEKAEGMADDTPMPAEKMVVNALDGSIAFAPMTFTKTGTYQYVITESGSAPGVTNDTAQITATIVIDYNQTTGQLYVKETTYTQSDESGFVFTNTYTATPADPIGIFTASKDVFTSDGSDYELVGGEFQFRITPSSNNPAEDPVKAAIVTNDANGNIQFATDAEGNAVDVVYTAPGTYTYTVSEVSANVAGMTFDDSLYTITVQVVDDYSDAKLNVHSWYQLEDQYSVDEIIFENYYEPDTTSAILGGMKQLTGKELTAGEFTFKLAAVGEAPMPDANTATNAATGEFQFGNITYTTAGIYTYEISEVNDGKAKYTYDDSVYTATVEVIDTNGKLAATVTYSDDVVFKNSYKPEAVTLRGETALKGTKTLTGRAMKDGEFVFQLKNATDEVVLEASNDVNGNFQLEPLTFEEAGTYYYTLVEKNTEAGGVTYDTDSYTVKVTVIDEGGYLAADVDYLDDNGQEAAVVFENSYKPQSTSVRLSAVKKLEGRTLQDGEFTFVLTDANGTTMTAQNDVTGVVLFSGIVYEQAGVYTYTIAEWAGTDADITYDDTVYTVTVTVEDDGNGFLNATVDNQGETITFTNVVGETTPSETPVPTPSAGPSELPAPSETPGPSDGPGGSETPGPSDGPDGSETPSPSDGPDGSETPDPSDGPDGSETPNPSGAPSEDPSGKPGKDPSTDPTQKPTTTQKPSTTSPKTTKAPSTSGSTSTPKTGDDSNAMLWIVLIIASMATIKVGVEYGRRKRSSH